MEKPEVIDYFVYEGEMARAERHSNRWRLFALILLIIAVGTNTLWVIREFTYEDVVMTQEATSDGSGDAIINGVAEGELNYYGNSEADDTDKTEESPER